MRILKAPVVCALLSTSACSLAFPVDDFATGTTSDDTLVARYFINEAENGTAPPTLLNSGEGAPDLRVNYGFDVAFTRVGSNRGLAFPVTDSEGGATGQIAAASLLGTTSDTGLTVELVVQLAGGGGLFSLGDDLVFRWDGFDFTAHVLTVDGDATAEWSFDPMSRHVLHLVVEPNGTAPLSLYVDGLKESPPAGPGLATAQLNFAEETTLALGNTLSGFDSLQGTLFYAALYSTALSPAEVAANAERLRANDDGP